MMKSGEAYMVKMAIAEDDKMYVEQLLEYIHRYEKETGVRIEISTFSDGDEIVEKYKAGFDIILLDIEMPILDGMSAAGEIRKMDPEVVIIFITNMPQYAIHGYSVGALDYILKPPGYFAFSQCLNKAIARMERTTTKYMTISVKGGVQKLEVSQIYYIESQKHNLIFHTAIGEFISTGAMRDTEAALKEFHFCRGNNGYLINLEHVDGIRDGCAIVKGEALLLSRGRKNAFLEELTDYVGEGMR